MKNNVKLFCACLCCLLMVTLFTSCNEKEPTYIQSHYYNVILQRSIGPDYNELREIQNAFDQAVGINGEYHPGYSSMVDDDMKAACEAVQSRYSNINSIYLVYKLVRTSPDAKSTDTIGVYPLGRALTASYVTYSFNSNEEEAFEELESMRATLGEVLYHATKQTLFFILGRHNGSSHIQSHFEYRLKNYVGKYCVESTEDENYIIGVCDSIAGVHANDTLAVDAWLSLSKTGVLNGQTTELWRTNFPANI